MKEQINLDEIIKSLFMVSKEVLIKMMNSLFYENFDVDLTEITFENSEFVSNDYDIIRGDLFLKITTEHKPYHYHIEFQTLQDTSMVIRMFEYGFQKAKELAKYEGADETVLYIPKQLVIYVEKNINIKDELKMRLIFPNGQEVHYVVPIMKYWEYDDKKIIEQKMYPLLPLQIFTLRYKMKGLQKKGGDLEECILEAKEVATIVAKEAKELYDKNEIQSDDLHKILIAVNNIFEYLNNRYGDDKKYEEELRKMTKTLYDPEVEKKGIEKGIELEKIEIAKEMLKEGEPLEKILKYSRLRLEKIEEIKKEIFQ